MRVENAHSARFKAEILRELLGQIHVSNEIADRYGVTQEQAALWMRHIENNLENIFISRSSEGEFSPQPSTRLDRSELDVLLEGFKTSAQ